MHRQAASTHIHISIFFMHIQLQKTNWLSRTTTAEAAAAVAATARQTDHALNPCIHCSKDALWNSFIHVRSKIRSSEDPSAPPKKNKTKQNHPKHKTKKKKRNSIQFMTTLATATADGMKILKRIKRKIS
jgi:hypothetical protein